MKKWLLGRDQQYSYPTLVITDFILLWKKFLPPILPPK
jgi:hypothetical protein